jgi:tryptophan synthase alpha chain
MMKTMNTEQKISSQTGLERLNAMFRTANEQGRPAFLPYFPIGYPTYEESLANIEVMAACDVDGFEIGIPFSDPLADGPVIQAASQIALENGITVKKALEAVRELRERGVHQPMLMMGYVNPMIAYGVEQVVKDAKAAGAGGFIIPDLPPEESSMFSDVCEREGMALIQFLAPTSNEARIRLVGEHATGFIYVVSVVGVTGARAELPEELLSFLQQVRTQVKQPLVLGFGISKPEHVRQISEAVNGFIVGSALVRAAKEGTEAVRSFTETLRHALDA